MDRYRRFDLQLLEKQISGNSIIVITDTIYFVSGAFFGRMEMSTLLRYILLVNMAVTCVLYHSFTVTKGELKPELITEKIVYFPTTRLHYLGNLYRRTLRFLLIQMVLTLLSLGVGYYGSNGNVDGMRVLESLLMVGAGVLISSGICLLVMHVMPYGVFLTMLAYLPLSIAAEQFATIMVGRDLDVISLSALVILIIVMTIMIWLLLLWAGVKLYERIC